MIIGSSDSYAIKIMKNLYKKFVKDTSSIVVMDSTSAELTKYAANSILACRISFINEIANLAEKVGANIEDIKNGIGSDQRIGQSFLNAGCGYGGSCFPKDVAALQKISKEITGESLKIIDATIEVNKKQKNVLYKKIIERFGNNIKDKNIAIWGLSFKPDTDDMREAPSIELINKLHSKGVNIHAYDPVATKEAKIIFKDIPIKYKKNKEDCLKNADALVIVTEWNDFKNPDFEKISNLMKSPIIFDGRNVLNTQKMKSHPIEYYPIGKPKLVNIIET